MEELLSKTTNLLDIHKYLHREEWSGEDKDWLNFKRLFVNPSGMMDITQILQKIQVDLLMKHKSKYAQLCAIIYNALFKCSPTTVRELIRPIPNLTGSLVKKSATEEERKALQMDSIPDSQELMTCPHPSTVWSVLLRKYESGSAVSRLLLVKKLSQLTVNLDIGFDHYAAELQEIFSRLSVMGDTFSEPLKTSYLLNGLPDFGDSMFAMINVEDSGMTFDKARSALITFFEQHKAREENKTGAYHTMFDTSRRKPSDRRKEFKGEMCASCLKRGRPAFHLEKDCFDLHPEKKAQFLQRKADKKKLEAEELSRKAEASASKQSSSSIASHYVTTSRAYHKVFDGPDEVVDAY